MEDPLCKIWQDRIGKLLGEAQRDASTMLKLSEPGSLAALHQLFLYGTSIEVCPSELGGSLAEEALDRAEEKQV